MMLLHTLSRLTFSNQPWKPLLSGFLLHYAAAGGYRPRLQHCVRCGKRMEEAAQGFFDLTEGGLCCSDCFAKGVMTVTAEQVRWMREALQGGASTWVDTEDTQAPYELLRSYVERRLERPLRSAGMLPR